MSKDDLDLLGELERQSPLPPPFPWQKAVIAFILATVAILTAVRFCGLTTP